MSFPPHNAPIRRVFPKKTPRDLPLLWTAVLFCLLTAFFAPGAGAAHTKVALLAEHSAVTPGMGTRLALHLNTEEGWHAYGKDPGEAGFPPSIEWARHDNATMGEWAWPPSREFVTGGIKTNVLASDAVIFIPLKIDPDARTGGQVELAGKISWLECNDKTCAPNTIDFSIRIPIATKPALSPENAGIFQGNQPPQAIIPDAKPAKLPETRKDAPAGGLQWEPWTPRRQQELLDAGRIVHVDFTAAWCVTCLVNKRVYSSPAVVSALREANVALLRADWTLRNASIATELQRYGRAAIPFGVFLQQGKPPVPLGELLTPGKLTAALDELRAPAAAATKREHTQQPPLAALAFLCLSGFLGGLLLNLMPCVFPVLGLKLLSLATLGEPRVALRHGLAYTAGVVLSFWALSGSLLALRKGGEALGWGFQLGQPAVVFAITTLLLLCALNLAGVFEIGLGAAGAGEKLRGTSGARGAFFSGLLATIIATPCSAPLLGGVLGAAFDLPPARAFLLFTCVALGLAAPLPLAAVAPGLRLVLPRPGAWMEAFRQMLSFPMFAGAAYFTWVLSMQAGGGSGFLQVLLALVLAAGSAWVYGRWAAPRHTRKVRRAATAAALLLLAAALAWGMVAVA
ncbi:MAG: thioredoxin family protein [Puniceicoccales bacterium]|jgi:thiol:disulfide interchange protein DsbD|nr:thioredoxin family protein [Puniceicoccales bacterium]